MPIYLLETAVASPRFNLLRLTVELRQHFATSRHGEIISELENSYGALLFKKIFERIIRSVFFIEPVNREITSTKFAVRWSNSDRFFDFRAGDPRFCSLEDCLTILDEILNALYQERNDEVKKDLIEKCIRSGLVSHEINLDYTSELGGFIHRPGNVQWQWGEEVRQTIGLRSYLRSIPGEEGAIFKSAIESKVSVKTYLTDRAQTGVHQTNREKRWEAHPRSVQFASRRTCWGIEHELLSQLCYFEEFPATVREIALERNLLEPRNDVSRCPVTLEPLKFSEFSQEILNPRHGRSKFQVGHMNPLKTVGRENPEAGHTRRNISWVSSDGNRIQGHLSLQETQDLIAKIAENYRAAR